MIWARIELPPSGCKHLSPPPIRLDLPPASKTPTTRSDNPTSTVRLEAKRRHVQTGLRHVRLFPRRRPDLDRAVFVLGDFANRVELGIGEDVGGGLHIGEGDAHGAVLNRHVGPGGKPD